LSRTLSTAAATAQIKQNCQQQVCDYCLKIS